MRECKTTIKLMKHIILIFILTSSFVLHSFSQDIKGKDTISIVKSGMGGIRLYQHGETLNMEKLTEILKPNSDAYAYLKKAKTNSAFSLLFSAIGGFAIGWELGTSLGGKSINWAVMGGGIGAVAISIPFTVGTKRNAKRAVEIYNMSH